MATKNGSGALVPDRQMQIKQLLLDRRESIAEIIPKHLNPERLIRVMLGCTMKTPRLQECTSASLLHALVISAELGLEPGGALGFMYLVPFRMKDGTSICTPIIGYRGLIDLMRRSGKLAQIEAHVVHEKDVWDLQFGTDPRLVHKPKMDGPAGAAVFVYCIARLKDGGTHVEVMTMADVHAVRARSKSKDDGPWVTDFEEMARKTVVRRAAKYLPLSTEIARAFEVDDEGEVIEDLPRPRPALVSDTTLAAEMASVAPSAANEKAKAAVKSRLVVDQAEGETEEQAKARADSVSSDPSAEPPDDVDLPT